MSNRRRTRLALFPCPHVGCGRVLVSAKGLTHHIAYIHTVPRDLQPPVRDDSEAQVGLEEDPSQDDTPLGSPITVTPRHSPPPRQPSGSPQRRTQDCHPELSLTPDGIEIQCHPIIDGTPCDEGGNDLEEASPPSPRPEPLADDYSPFPSRAAFEFAEFLYTEEQMSASKIDRLLHLLACMYPHDPPHSLRSREMYALIDQIRLGEVPWDSFSVKYNGQIPTEGPVPPWMTQEHEVWFQDPLYVLENQLSNQSFAGEIDYSPKRVFCKGKRRYGDVMSGNWAWKQCDILAQDEENHGAMFAPIILGSDKTTVSVGTGQNDFYPLYASIGNVHNSVRRAHRNALSLIGFLAIPKTSKEYTDCADYRKFRRQLFHASLEHILSSLKPYMKTARVTRCSDGHFRRVIYGLGPYIADYPEQALLACIVQNWCPKCTAPPNDLDGPIKTRRTHEHTAKLMEQCSMKELWDNYGIVGDLVPFTDSFPRADIHELLTPDLLHQIIKGTFKDHLVEWVQEYIYAVHTKDRANEIMADIDRRIAAAPSFPGLRRFAQGRGFKQWTGNDSKGLMKMSTMICIYL
ncbi:hypothetical protein H0H92_004641 [Tricholoma furcatifolium]|nr:hypothetical protein H0H92_004641 [Tricholoma furcatifolium]